MFVINHSLQAKSKIKAAYDNAKRALPGGLVKTKEQATKEAEELQVEVDRLKNELEAYKRKEELWLRRCLSCAPEGHTDGQR